MRKVELRCQPDKHAFKEATPTDYKTERIWRIAQPSDAQGRGKWWEIFGDPQINALEDELTVSNQNLKVADARFREARAMIGYQRANEFPTISVGANTSSLQEFEPSAVFPDPQPIAGG